MPECMYRYRPLGLLFEGEGGAPGDGGTGEGGNDEGKDLGFPSGTPIVDMTAEQQAAYWKHQSRKHEKVAESRKDYEDQKRKAAELDQIKAENQTEHQKAVEDARRQGENLGAEKYLGAAVEGHLRGATGKTAEEVQAALKFVDVTKFLDDKGDLDPDLITAFAGTLGTSTPANEGQQQRPAGGGIRQELHRAGGGKQQRTSGSLAERKKTRLAEIQSKSTSTQ